MWIYDKLFNRKIEGKSSLDDLAENIVVNKETNTTEISGNVNVDGNFTGNSIIENMSGYSIIKGAPPTNATYNFLYGGIVKNGNKLTCACALIVNSTSGIEGITAMHICDFIVPTNIASKLYEIDLGTTKNCLGASNSVPFYQGSLSFKNSIMVYVKRDATHIRCLCYPTEKLEANTNYLLRFEITFLLSDNMVGN